MRTPERASGAETAWTGGQYSLFRALLGLFLAVRFGLLLLAVGALPASATAPLAGRLPNLLDGSAPLAATVLLVSLAASAALALGTLDRAAALLLLVPAACAGAGAPDRGLVAVALLVAHALLPPAPLGSLAARGRVDPRGDWAMDASVWSAAWALLGGGYAASGAARLLGVEAVDLLAELDGAAFGWVQLAFLPLALARRTRPAAWIALALLQVTAALGPGAPGPAVPLALLLAHLLALDPAWIPPRRAAATETLFYDGDCGLCHGFVRFVLAEDREAAFRLAPLQGPTFATSVPPELRDELPDSIVAWTADGRLLVRSDAVAHVLAGLGGVWRVAGALLRLVPHPLRDAGYDAVARVRHRLFAKPDGACPLVPPDLGVRFMS